MISTFLRKGKPKEKTGAQGVLTRSVKPWLTPSPQHSPKSNSCLTKGWKEGSGTGCRREEGRVVTEFYTFQTITFVTAKINQDSGTAGAEATSPNKRMRTSCRAAAVASQQVKRSVHRAATPRVSCISKWPSRLWIQGSAFGPAPRVSLESKQGGVLCCALGINISCNCGRSSYRHSATDTSLGKRWAPY